MQKISYLNALGENVVFDDKPPFVFWKVSGVEPPDCLGVYAQAPGLQGANLTGLRLGKRLVKVSLHAHGADVGELYALRKRLFAATNAVAGAGVLVYENEAVKLQTTAFAKSFNYGARAGGLQTVEIAFECPSPFWLDFNESVIRLAYVEGGMSFPVRLPAYFGTLGYRAKALNDGNSPTPVEISIGGGSVNPTLTNKTTGQRISVARIFEKGERLIIGTDPDGVRVDIESVDPETNLRVRRNGFGYLTEDSELFMLEPGTNELLFLTDDANKRVSIEIRYRKRYVGA